MLIIILCSLYFMNYGNNKQTERFIYYTSGLSFPLSDRIHQNALKKVEHSQATEKTSDGRVRNYYHTCSLDIFKKPEIPHSLSASSPSSVQLTF